MFIARINAAMPVDEARSSRLPSIRAGRLAGASPDPMPESVQECCRCVNIDVYNAVSLCQISRACPDVKREGRYACFAFRTQSCIFRGRRLASIFAASLIP